jgi:hypothetical protein
MLNKSKKQTPSRQDMQDLAKSLHATQDEVWAVLREMGLTTDTDLIALSEALDAAYSVCARAAGMLETVLSHKEVVA